MHPELFQIGPWHVRSYGFLLAMSFLCGCVLAGLRARRAGIEPSTMRRVVVLTLVGTVVGSRLAYALVNPAEFAGRPWAVFAIFQGDVMRVDGLVMNGGVVSAVLLDALYLRWKRLPVLAVLDVIAPALALGIFLTRIGCFLNGCCYGEPTTCSWGVVFPEASLAGTFQRSLESGALARGDAVPLHPTQLYSAGYGLAILFVVVWAERRFARFDGFSTALMLLLYAIARFTVEFWRHYYDETGAWLGLTHNQWLSVMLFTGAFAALVALPRRLMTYRSAG